MKITLHSFPVHSKLRQKAFQPSKSSAKQAVVRAPEQQERQIKRNIQNAATDECYGAKIKSTMGRMETE